jgi:hypothetical protein
MTKQYVKVKSAAKSEVEIQEETEQSYSFSDEFLEGAMKGFDIYQSGQETEF